MFCKFNFKSIFLSIICLIIGIYSNAQGPDSLFVVPRNPLLVNILSLPDLNASITLSEETNLLPLKNSNFSSNAQKLYKAGEQLYVIIEQTGFVYQLVKSDSTSCTFKRLDHTVNLNYNINCKNFIYNKELYSYGGYGFWKTNGHLRKFNFQDSEWDIIPLNKEIISTYFLWFSEQKGRLYLPFQRKVNAGIIGNENITGVPDYTSYYLDLSTHQWEKLGDLKSDVIKIVKNINSSTEGLAYEDGILFLSNDDTYLFDYVNNKLYKSKNADLNQFLIRRANLANMFIYRDQIYSYNSSSNSFITYPFKISDFEWMKTSLWGVEATIFYIILIIVIILLVVLTAIWFFNRSVKRKLEVAQLQILKTKSITQAFSGTEVALINLLLNSTLNNKVVDIHQINHVLGIKDKNVGLQKKVRSDVMKAINDKYEFISQSKHSLIGSSRKVDDKRFYEYFITATEVKTIQRILENNV